MRVPTIDDYLARVIRVHADYQPEWPVLVVLLAGDRLTVSPRGELDIDWGAYSGPVDAWISRPRPPVRHGIPEEGPPGPHLEAGYWPDDDSGGVLLPGMDVHRVQDMSGSWRIPPLPGTLRLRVTGWELSQETAQSSEWGSPQRIDAGFIGDDSEYLRIWTATARPSGGGPVTAQPPDYEPYLAMHGCGGGPEWDLPALPDMERLPAPTGAPSASVETLAWLRARVARYGGSRRTGQHWRELLELLS